MNRRTPGRSRRTLGRSRRTPGRSPSVIAADTGHAIILLDIRAGRVRALAGTAAAGWHDPSGVFVPVQVREAAASWGASETQAALPTLAAPSVTWAVRALAAIVTTLAIRSGGARGQTFARMIWLAGGAGRCHRAAEAPQAKAALDAVRWAAQFVPVRFACLEESVAASVALALSGRSADWRHGIACDPVRMHAWIEVDGRPVGEPSSTSDCTPLICIPQSTRAQEAPHE